MAARRAAGRLKLPFFRGRHGTTALRRGCVAECLAVVRLAERSPPDRPPGQPESVFLIRCPKNPGTLKTAFVAVVCPFTCVFWLYRVLSIVQYFLLFYVLYSLNRAVYSVFDRVFDRVVYRMICRKGNTPATGSGCALLAVSGSVACWPLRVLGRSCGSPCRTYRGPPCKARLPPRKAVRFTPSFLTRG